MLLPELAYMRREMSKLKPPSSSKFGFGLKKTTDTGNSGYSHPQSVSTKASDNLSSSGGLRPDAPLHKTQREDNFQNVCSETDVKKSNVLKPRPISSILPMSVTPLDHTNGSSNQFNNHSDVKTKSGLKQYFAKSLVRGSSIRDVKREICSSQSDYSLSNYTNNPPVSQKSVSAIAINSISSVQSKSDKDDKSNASKKGSNNDLSATAVQTKLPFFKKLMPEPKSKTTSTSETQKQGLPGKKISTISDTNTRVQHDIFFMGNMNRDTKPAPSGENKSNNIGGSETSLSSIQPEKNVTEINYSQKNSDTSGLVLKPIFEKNDKNRPMVEICPLAKQQTISEFSNNEGTDVKSRPSSELVPEDVTYQLDGNLMNDILSEMTALRTQLTELRHHLIGKQEHEDKMREELQRKNDIITALYSQLQSCGCHHNMTMVPYANEIPLL